MNIQIKATKEIDGCIDETSLEDADYISVYRGEPGNYRWIADFNAATEWSTARNFAKQLAEREGHHYADHIIYGEQP